MSVVAKSTKEKSKRVLTFDLLRGYFMVSIILNHLQWYPSGFDWVAFRGSLFVSAAEGFFFISGIVLGIVRGRKLINVPFREAALLLLKRGVLLYVISIVLMLAFTLIGWLFMDNPGLKPGIRPIDQPFGEILAGALSLNYLYGWADFLRLYSVFLIASPLALWLLRKNKWYILIALSIGIWALFPYAKEATERSSELLMILSWQLLFFAGMTLGFYWDTLAEKWRTLTKKIRSMVLTPILIIAAVTLIGNILLTTIPALHLPGTELCNALQAQLWPLFDKNTLTPLRLVLFGLWFTLGFYLFNKYEKIIIQWLGWILLPFGKNSLYVYILHAVILFFAHLIIAPGLGGNPFINFISTIIILGSIYLAVKKRFLFKIIPR